MAKKLGISINTFRKSERGIYYPSVHILYLLRNRLGVSLEWYLFGSGPVFRADIANAREKRGAGDPLEQDIEEMTGIMRKVPMMRHAILLHFQELKVKHKEIIREELEKET